MKLEPLVELTDIEHESPSSAEWVLRIRPDETTADFIAAGADVGGRLAPMAQWKNDLCERGCSLCSRHPLENEGFFRSQKRMQRTAMADYGVTWNPDLRL